MGREPTKRVQSPGDGSSCGRCDATGIHDAVDMAHVDAGNSEQKCRDWSEAVSEALSAW